MKRHEARDWKSSSQIHHADREWDHTLTLYLGLRLDPVALLTAKVLPPTTYLSSNIFTY